MQENRLDLLHLHATHAALCLAYHAIDHIEWERAALASVEALAS
jgi:hypothetical protein